MKTKFFRALIPASVLFAGAMPGRAQAPVPASTPPEKAAPAAPRPASTPPAPVPAAKPAADPAAAPAARPDNSAPAARPAPSPNAKPAGVGQMTREFGEQSKDLLEKRNALIERLRLAKTDEEKQRIIGELREQQKQRLEQQREIARQIREQMQNSRKENLPAASGR